MSTYAEDVAARLEAAFAAHADPSRAAAMSAYMRGLFPFLGIPSPLRRSLAREALAGLTPGGEADVAEMLALLWQYPEREYQYAAVDLAVRHLRLCGPGFVASVEAAVVTKSWWDTVDGLAAGCAGELVLRYPGPAAVMDTWAAGSNMWLARTAILHQLRFKARTDADRLFRYCLLRAGESEFFIRKAIGWALREFSKTDADAVRQFVAEHTGELSGLSRREALLWLDRRAARGA